MEKEGRRAFDGTVGDTLASRCAECGKERLGGGAQNECKEASYRRERTARPRRERETVVEGCAGRRRALRDQGEENPAGLGRPGTANKQLDARQTAHKGPPNAQSALLAAC